MQRNTRRERSSSYLDRRQPDQLYAERFPAQPETGLMADNASALRVRDGGRTGARGLKSENNRMNGMDRLGPWPEKAVAAFRDLGLTDQEIARYFRVQPKVVRQAARNAKDRAQLGLPPQDSGQTKSGTTQTERGFRK